MSLTFAFHVSFPLSSGVFLAKHHSPDQQLGFWWDASFEDYIIEVHCSSIYTYCIWNWDSLHIIFSGNMHHPDESEGCNGFSVLRWANASVILFHERLTLLLLMSPVFKHRYETIAIQAASTSHNCIADFSECVKRIIRSTAAWLSSYSLFP